MVYFHAVTIVGLVAVVLVASSLASQPPPPPHTRPPRLALWPHMSHPVHLVLDELPAERARADRRFYWENYDVEALVEGLGAESCHGLEVIHVDELQAELEAMGDAEAELDYVRANVPIVIRGAMDSWPGLGKFDLAAMEEAYANDQLVVQDARRKGTVRFKDYLEYMADNGDANPAYAFDAPFLASHPELGEAYMRPPGLRRNMWDGMPDGLAPDWRWLLIGPPRSGSAFHTDPFNTSAWNALVSGRKTWAFYPPNVYSPPGLYGTEMPGLSTRFCAPSESWGGPQECSAISALEWFAKTAPFLADQHAPIYCDQRPGDILYVPQGWWHAVLNVEPSVAITENSINVDNARDMLESMKRAALHDSGYVRVLAAFLDLWTPRFPDLFTDADRAFVEHYAPDDAPPPTHASAYAGTPSSRWRRKRKRKRT
ncbi:bifunctional arginine demethylase and lysyl-hydroxylase JMJD6 [Thecamonas trahens ATCC 50062]|uniref:Bifunctional arginine demethylase and lysyl-hydroxylase JMJD6 n=1 Tax=Thecamonas trahens ATCC 50062 TaxID=461836 RepID=A0A0L0DJ93_THETB|nr:bifunctional arginine demethylase and lysyl-hydroxylase JMJD6 [Thecamonas trahens ATCC 50062]KNC52377.1 bifunctional arginine demethylase and lysyl-hydroxylase JMJD6 [Thecamonas trahens ATCC 50062]|eukprot:XP_013755424.1 bifunctional arginine demethylase and lysyl-hydroxylase JMJD6 [Thecamonas trahens ATCC 50062]